MKTPSSPSVCEVCHTGGCRQVFCQLEDEHLHQLMQRQSTRNFRKNETIFQQGDQPPGLYIVLRGIVKVYKTDESGKEQIVRLEREGDLLGYRSLISGEAYGASASSLTEVQVCFIPRGVFTHLLNVSPGLSKKIISVLTHDLRTAEHKLAHMAHRTVRERLAEALLMLQQQYGMESDGQTLTVTLSREDLANLVGTATETLIRTLSDFRQEGAVELRGKRIVMTDPQKLLRIERGRC